MPVEFFKKIISLIFITIIVFIGVLLFFKHNKSQSITLESCKNSSLEKIITCVENFAHSSIQKEPSTAEKILNELWSGQFGADLRVFSPFAHHLGMALIDQNADLVSAINFCGQSFKGACVHGVIMEYIDKNFPAKSLAGDFIQSCDSIRQQVTGKQYNYCVHGIGHELRAKLSGSNERIVEECDYFQAQDKNACASGVFMEASTGNLGSGYHSESQVGKFEFDCLKVSQQYMLTCYSSLGSYTQYEADGPPFTETYTLCSSLPEMPSAYCFAGVNERLLMAKNGNINSAIEFCKTLTAKQYEGCLMVKSNNLDNLE